MGTSVSVDMGAVVVVGGGGGGGGGGGEGRGGGVEGLWPNKVANVDKRAADGVGAPRTPGRGGRGGFVARGGSGSVALNAETVNEG